MTPTIFDSARLILDAIDQPVFVHDAEFKILYANKAYIKISKLKEEDLIGKLYYKVFPKTKSPLKSCLKTLKTKHATLEEIETAKNQWYLSRSVPVELNPENYFAVHILENISPKKAIIKLLQEEKETLDTIFEHAVDPMFLHDVKGNIVKTNEAAAKSLGYSKTELEKLSVFNIEKGITQKALNSTWQKAEEGNPIYLKGIHKRKDGSEFPAEINLALLKLKQKPYLIASVRNISPHIEFEKKLQHRVDIETLARKISYSLLDTHNPSKALNNVVASLGKFSNVDRAYIFTYNAKKDTVSNTHEWCKKGVKAFKASLQELPFKTGFPWLATELISGKLVNIADKNKLPKKAIKLKKELERESIFSALLVPFMHRKKFLGFIGFDSVHNSIDWAPGDIELLETTAKMLTQTLIQNKNENKLEKLNVNLKKVFYHTIETLAKMSEQHDPYTAGHQFRVASLSSAIAKQMGLAEDKIQNIYLGALIHDIGKIRVPTEILSSPRTLSKEEMDIIRIHPAAGHEIVKNIPFKPVIGKIISEHHERLDGSGYPKGLKANDICLEVRIVAVADTFEAMTSHRPYRPAKPKKEAIQFLKENAGKLYDESVVKACLSIVEKRGFRLPKAKFESGLFE